MNIVSRDREVRHEIIPDRVKLDALSRRDESTISRNKRGSNVTDDYDDYYNKDEDASEGRRFRVVSSRGRCRACKCGPVTIARLRDGRCKLTFTFPPLQNVNPRSRCAV